MKKILYGTEITWTTLIGVIGNEFPISRGNCFSLKCNGGKEYRIVNFYLENLEELIRRGLTFPIRLKKLVGKKALLDDERISNKWYNDTYCTVCCPDEYLLDTQKMEIDRQIRIGIREEKVLGNGIVGVSVKVNSGLQL